MQNQPLIFYLGLAIFAILRASAESHTIQFTNNCGFGRATLVQDGIIVASGEDFTSNGPITAIAYLQTGQCGLNGEECNTINTTLRNPINGTNGSSTVISASESNKQNLALEFEYYNGCDGAETIQPGIVVDCEVDNVDLAITFCD